MANPTPLQRRQSGYRLSAGEWFNAIIDRVNGLVAGTLTGTFKGTFDGLVGSITAAAGLFTTLGASGQALLASTSVTDFQQNGITTFTGQTLAAAGATQGTASAISKSAVYVTVTASTQGIKLPTAAEGKRVVIFSAPTVGVKVYPFSGDKIGAAATNTAVVLASGKGNIYQAIDATTWRVVKGA